MSTRINSTTQEDRENNQPVRIRLRKEKRKECLRAVYLLCGISEKSEHTTAANMTLGGGAAAAAAAVLQGAFHLSLAC